MENNQQNTILWRNWWTSSPEIRLTRSKDGTTGQALFSFEKPQALSSITEGEITGMRMIDNEGEILTREVKVKFVDGEPIFLEELAFGSPLLILIDLWDLQIVMPNQMD